MASQSQREFLAVRFNSLVMEFATGMEATFPELKLAIRTFRNEITAAIMTVNVETPVSRFLEAITEAGVSPLEAVVRRDPALIQSFTEPGGFLESIGMTYNGTWLQMHEDDRTAVWAYLYQFTRLAMDWQELDKVGCAESKESIDRLRDIYKRSEGVIDSMIASHAPMSDIVDSVTDIAAHAPCASSTK